MHQVLSLQELGLLALLTKGLSHLLVVSCLVLKVLVLDVSLLLKLHFTLLGYQHVLLVFLHFLPLLDIGHVLGPLENFWLLLITLSWLLLIRVLSELLLRLDQRLLVRFVECIPTVWRLPFVVLGVDGILISVAAGSSLVLVESVVWLLLDVTLVLSLLSILSRLLKLKFVEIAHQLLLHRQLRSEGSCLVVFLFGLGFDWFDYLPVVVVKSLVEHVHELAVDHRNVVVVNAEQLSVHQGLDGCKLVQNNDVVVF